MSTDLLANQNAARRNGEIAQMLERMRENEVEDRRRFPADWKHWQPFLPVLERVLAENAATPGPVDADVRFYITEDRMCAYACLLPPLNGGSEIRMDMFGKGLLHSGISAGLEEEIPLTYLAKREYLHLFPVARGTPPQDGTDGRREDLFEPRPVFVMDVREGKTADFATLRPVQLIRRGEALARITPATPGKEGMDVTGQKLPCRAGVPAKLELGFNVKLSEDGLRLEAMENGAVFVRDGVMFVQTAVIRTDSIKLEDDLVWLAYIDGNIPHGVKLNCTNGVLVMGEARGVEIHAKGSVRVQRGIREGCRIEAGGQVLAPVIEDSTVTAGKDVFAETIRNSDVTAGGSVFVLGGSGIIEGGSIRARDQVECIQIGGPAGMQTVFSLGSSAELTEEIARLSAELDQARETLEGLRKHIMKLRGTGSRLSSEDAALLEKLVEQRELYESQVAELTTQLKQARDERRNDRDSQILCRIMEPPVTVQIGERTGNFQHPERDCRIRLYAGQVVAK